MKAFFAVTSDTETVSFLVGTQSLRHTNLLYKVRQSLGSDCLKILPDWLQILQDCLLIS